MARAEASVTIDRPVEEVFAFMSNPENDEQWASGISDVAKTSEGPPTIGTTYRGVIRFLGQRLEWTSEVTKYQPSEAVVFSVSGGPLQLEETVSFEPVDEGTKVDVVYEGDPGGLFELGSRVVVRMWQGQMEGDLAKLKGILEAQA
jgi:carbon monoxide dehydrogenase subunit G